MRRMLRFGALLCAVCFTLILLAGCTGEKAAQGDTGATDSVVTPTDDGSIELPMLPS